MHCLDRRRHLFGNPAVAAEAWTEFLEGPAEEIRRNAGRRSVPYSRVKGWVAARIGLFSYVSQLVLRRREKVRF